MSIETDVRALLAGFGPLTSLVGSAIALNAADPTLEPPLVVFSTRHEYTHNLLGQVMADTCAVSAQCWAKTAIAADAVADQVVAALATAPLPAGAVVIDRSSGYDAELDLHATLLTMEWWQG
jgi:hypothetical protein